MTMTVPVSVIIPVAAQDEAWRALVPTLVLPRGSEIILAHGVVEPDVSSEREMTSVPLRTVQGRTGRAGQMNAGASRARNAWLWFLHADSSLAEDTLQFLADCLSRDGEALFYFDLRFCDDGPSAMWLNQLAVRFRSDVLKMPFGDQGFLLPKRVFDALDGYREDLAYGEDHVLAWKARQEGFPVMRTGGRLLTSARKYERNGWAKVTAHHVWLTLLQAAPQAAILLKRRWERMTS